MLIYIIRHGETNLNAQGVMQGWLDEPLNEAGVHLAEVTGRAMKGIRFDACISSPLGRAKQTAELILKGSENAGVPVESDDRIREINFGKAEGKPLLKCGVPEDEARKFFTDPFHFAGFPGGENLHQVCARTQGFLNELIKRDDGKTYLIATHGCALRGMLNKLYDNPADYWHIHVPYNCVVNIVEAEAGTAKLIADDIVYYDPKYIVDRYSAGSLK